MKPLCTQCNGTGFYRLGSWDAKYTCSRCFGTKVETAIVAYAGIGSRETPVPIAKQMELFATIAATKGYALRSGEAPANKLKPETDSADLAFERGCDLVKGRKVIRTATAWDRAIQHAAQFHPNWSACDDRARSLHARNSLIMLGDQLDNPVLFVACWTAGGQVVGGTGQSLRIAEHHKIPVFNFAVDGHFAALMKWINGNG